MYICTTLPSTVCAPRQTRCTLVQHIYVCMYVWIPCRCLAEFKPAMVNMHPAQQQTSSPCNNLLCAHHWALLYSKPVSNNHVRTWCVKSIGAGSRGYRTATQKTHHTLCVSYSKKILREYNAILWLKPRDYIQNQPCTIYEKTFREFGQIAKIANFKSDKVFPL